MPIPLQPAVVLPDSQAAAVSWAKADADLAAILTKPDSSISVSTRLPEGALSPWLRVIRVGGGPDPGEAPIDVPLLQWDCFAWTDQGQPDDITAHGLARILAAKARVFVGEIPDAYIYGFTIVTGPVRMTDDERGWSRWRVDMTCTLRRR